MIATACWSSAWAKLLMASTKNTLSKAGLTSGKTSLAPIRGCCAWWSIFLTSSFRVYGWAGTILSKCMPRTSQRSSIPGRQPWFWRRRLRDTAWARRVKVRTSPTSRRSSMTTSCACSAHDAPFYRPADDSPEIRYMQERRKQLGGYLPERKVRSKPIKAVSESHFEEFYKGTEGREASTTMVFVRLLAKLLRDPEIGKLIVPIIPDEARTFGMEALFRQVGIYSSVGQLYEPVDMDTLLYYKEAKNGQILEEGITEAGSISSLIAAGTAYSNHGINTIPFFIYYSMFGFQRIGDLIWAAGDMRCRGFLVGGTAGRTTLAGEGLQHQDGHSHVLALSLPNLRAYDPAFAYEIAVIIQDGIKRMYVDQESIFYYLTVTNEPLPMPEMPRD